MTQLEICLLGTFQIKRASTSITEFTSNKVRALFAYLVVESDRPHMREALATLLWPESDQRAALSSLRNALANLRLVIGDRKSSPPFLHISRDAIQFNPDSNYHLDAAELINHDSKPQIDIRRRITAVERYRGPFLEGFSIPDSAAFEEWASLWRERLERKTLEGLHWLAAYYETRGDITQALVYARRQAALDPWVEEGHHHIMRLLAISGQREQAIRQYQTLREILSKNLKVVPSQKTSQLYQEILSGNFSAAKPKAHPPHNLPQQLSTFIGREAEIEALKQAILSSQTRLVTVTGTGGTGKTRLALEVSRGLLDAFPQGVFLVEISSQNTADSFLPIIAQVIGLDFSLPTSLTTQSADAHLQDQLLDYLQDKTMLLVLDSFETILDASVQVYDLLRVTSCLKILITSRARLNIEGETVFPLAGLSVPSMPEAPDETDGYESLDLFVDIARRTYPAFSLTVKNRPAIAEICRQTQGMPLGILLAAGWCGVLEPEEIVLEIQRSLDFLSDGLRSLPDRQQSLRATFDYSWCLLAPPQRLELMRLSVFPGAFSADRASQVCGVSLQALKTLIDQSLLQHSPKGRFRLHDLLRQFTREKLNETSQEALTLRRKFCQVYLDALSGWSARLKSDDQLQVLAEMNLEQDNFRLAWEWAVQQESIQFLEQALDGFCRYFYLNCRYQEGLDLCRQSEQRLGEICSPVLQAGLRRWQGVFLVLQGERQLALQIIQPLIAELQENGSAQPGLAGELAAAGLVLTDIQNANPTLATLELAQQSLRLFRSLNSSWDIARALCTITSVHDLLGNRLECYSTALEAIEILGPKGDPYLVTLGKTSLSYCYMMAGDYQIALDLVQELVAYYRRVGDRYSQARANRMLVYAYFYAGRFAEARSAVIHYHEDVKTQEVILKKGVRRAEDFLGLPETAVDLFTGQYDDAFSKSEKYGRDNEYIYPLCQAIIGIVYMIREDLGQAVVHLERSRRIYRQFERQDHTGWPLAFLSLVSYRMKEYEKSRSYLVEVLEYAEKYPVITVICLSLADLALFLAEGGDVEQAIEIYTAVTTHPMAKNAILFYDLFQQRIDALAAGLPSEVIDQARQQGRGQNLRELVQKYRQRLIQQPDFLRAP